jgi:plasmid maintenance system killer protein
MELSFATRKLKKQMEDGRILQKVYGQLANPIRRRLTTLAVASSLSEVPSGPPDRCHALSGKRLGQFAVVLTGNWRLVFEPDPRPASVSRGGLDLLAVTAITIIEIVDYHGQ